MDWLWFLAGIVATFVIEAVIVLGLAWALLNRTE